MSFSQIMITSIIGVLLNLSWVAISSVLIFAFLITKPIFKEKAL